jgi:hypothetical protein
MVGHYQVRNLAEVLISITGTDGAAKTSKQLGARINILRDHQGDLRVLIYQQTSNGTPPDEAVEDTLDSRETGRSSRFRQR